MKRGHEWEWKFGTVLRYEPREPVGGMTGWRGMFIVWTSGIAAQFDYFLLPGNGIPYSGAGIGHYYGDPNKWIMEDV